MHRIGYVLGDGFQLMALATQSVFEFANLVAGEPVYALENYSATGGELRSSSGLAVGTHSLQHRGPVDTWLFTGVVQPLEQPPASEVLALLRRVAPRARRVAAICTGAFVLAEAGVLSGRRATTHWAHAPDLQRLYPDVQVDAERIHIADGPIWTSAGMTAGLDMVLAMVEQDLGAELARSVAHRLVMQQQRSGGQSQHSELLALAPKSDRVQTALEYARRNLARPLSVEELAEAAHLSPRQFSRVFAAETGRTPAKAVEGLRLEAARLMIERSRHPLEVVARENGFRDRRHLREAFMRGFGVTPQALRRGRREAA